MRSAVVTNIQGCSIHDGPGIRTVVFFKGCPLRCKWCANPENLLPSEQPGFLRDACRNCGRCAEACGNGAIVPGEAAYRIDRARCASCFACVERCYYGALVRYGTRMTAAEIFDRVRRDRMFYEQSGGGVTVSGGEPLRSAACVRELFALCRDERIGTCVETCGFAPRAAFEAVLPLTELFLFDLKLMDPEAHRAHTSRRNDLILDNAAYLVGSGAGVVFRQPLIPGVNDTEENIAATARFMKSLGEGGLDIQLMPFHRMGAGKYRALDLPYAYESTAPQSAEAVNAVMRRYCELGVRCTVSE